MLSPLPHSFFVEMPLKSTALLGGVWLAALPLRRRSAAVRHLLWSVAFAAVLILPFLSLTLPAWRVPVARSLLAYNFVFSTSAQASAQEPAAKAGRFATAALSLKSERDWGLILMAIWAAGTAVSFGQMLIGLAAIERLRRRANPIPMPGFSTLTKLLGIRGEVNLLATTQGGMPITYGLFRPTIFIPADATEWSAERSRVVLLHELAHVRRGDGGTQLLARSVLALYWWNPAVWAAWREFLKERERAADDMVLSAGACASQYASHLLEIACSRQTPMRVGWAAVAMARRSQLEGRLSAILDSGRDRRAPRRASALTASLAAIVMMAPVAAVEAKSDTAQAAMLNQTSVSPAAALLIKEGDVAREQGKLKQAKAIYKKALAVLGNGPEAATVLIHLGTTELATADFGQATGDFERAQTADSGKTSEARMWMAIAQQRQNNLEAADALYQSALAAEDPNSTAAATIMDLYAELLQEQDRKDDANAMRKQAAVTRAAQTAQALLLSQPSTLNVRRIGGKMSAPALVSKVEPEYTEEARIAKYAGSVVLSIEVGDDGIVRNIKVIRGLGFGLDQKAIEAVRQWRFKPGVDGGQPVPVAARVEVNFKLCLKDCEKGDVGAEPPGHI